MRWNLNHKTALITGGTKGIGEAITNELLSLGARVIVIARNENDLLESIESWKQKGYDVNGIAADITNYDSYANIVAHISDIKIDVLINNVGGNFPKKLIDYTTDEIYQIFNLNVLSVIKFTQCMFEKLKASENNLGHYLYDELFVGFMRYVVGMVSTNIHTDKKNFFLIL